VSDIPTLERRIRELRERFPDGAPTAPGTLRIDRRRFLLAGGQILSASLLAACNSYGPRSARGILRFAERRNESVERWLFREGSWDRPRPHARDAGSAFPVYYIAHSIPVWNEAANGPWALEVAGLVDHPLRLTLADLLRLAGTTQRVDHFCVEGWTAVGSWTGIPLRQLAAIVKPRPAAQYVDFQSFDDGYHESWDIESAMHPQTLIAYGLDGRLLGPAHGGPARVHSPVKLGYKNTKYLTKVVFMAERNGGYWSDQGYEWYGGV
jgi:DMSO/TMAO reductase YedYZ molybdopterin-dependent catalytic subunit